MFKKILTDLKNISNLCLDIIQGLLNWPEGEHHHREQELVLQLPDTGELRYGVETLQSTHTGPAVQVSVPLNKFCTLDIAKCSIVWCPVYGADKTKSFDLNVNEWTIWNSLIIQLERRFDVFNW